MLGEAAFYGPRKNPLSFVRCTQDSIGPKECNVFVPLPSNSQADRQIGRHSFLCEVGTVPVPRVFDGLFSLHKRLERRGDYKRGEWSKSGNQQRHVASSWLATVPLAVPSCSCLPFVIYREGCASTDIDRGVYSGT